MIALTEAIAAMSPKPAARSVWWAPIYLDPLPSSGERITVAVVAWDADEHVITRALSPKVARCMFGDDASVVLGIVDLVCDSLRAHLDTTPTLDGWSSPVRDAVFVGRPSAGYADTVAEVAQAGRMLASSLLSPAEPSSPSGTDEADDNGDEWERQIREATLRVRQTFAPRFNHKVALRDGAPATHIGYLGDRLAAQFGRLIPGRGLTNHRNRAKAYITDLQMLRDNERSEVIARPFYELMLWLPPSDSIAYSDQQRADARGAFVELEAFGDAHDLRVAALSDSAAAVQRILHAEEAA